MAEHKRPKWAAWADHIRSLDDPAKNFEKPEALDDLVVLDLSSRSMAGCFCSSLLAELGAETIRIEPPGGDLVRTYSPGGVMHRGTGLAYLQEGRNKYHITLNLEKEEGREILKCLAGAADVLIETYPTGVMEEWGIGYEELSKLNPRLIYTSISAFGRFGPESGRRQYDYDNVSQARSGIQYGTGEILPEGKTYDEMPYAVPTKAGPWIAWAVSGTFGAMGILAALHYRCQTGEGQAIDIASPEAYERLHDYALHWYADQGVLNERFGNLDTALWLYGFFPTKDGGVFLGGLRLEMWKAFVDIIGKYEEWGAEEWTSLAPFMKKDWQLKYQAMINPETMKYTSEELTAKSVEYAKTGRLAPITTVVAPIVSPADAMKDEVWRDRGIFTPVQDPVYGSIVCAQAQWKATETPPRTKWVCRPVGYDNGFIYLKYLGFGPGRLKELSDQGVI
ncbi:MAG TPA: CoA transferase [Syntrophales bacterium]|nr:CoA transferase [Syntrophales bacterium]HOM07173.1 CoA transferase [Syntrophales bacterium]HOO00432.1 CoA transferase [Syntrophales bacterium]HPC01362.1 CoA transferase [Syntrophales bacterium]HPQ06748.1 CoA transferase [Syntrophales bacterium]